MSTFFWNLYARWYDLLRTLHPYERLHARVIELMQLLPHLKVLDVGCGTGNTIEKIVVADVHGIHITGLDRSTSMLARAGRKLRGAKVHLTHSIGSAERFDRIISINSLYTMEDRQAMVADWYKRLEDGGLLIIANPFRPKLFDIFAEHFRTIWERKDWQGLLGFMVRLPLWLCLITSNLIIAKRAHTKVYAFLSAEELEGLFTSLGFVKITEEITYGGTCLLYSFQKKSDARIRRVQTHAELHSGYRLRYQVYCNETKSLDPSDYPDQVEEDGYDKFAVHFIAQTHGQTHGYLRLVRGPEGALLLEESFCLPSDLHDKRSELIEVSRWIVSAPHRGTGLWFELVDVAVSWAETNGYPRPVMAAIETLWEGLKKRGWGTNLWGGYQQYHGTMSAPGTLKCRTL